MSNFNLALETPKIFEQVFAQDQPLVTFYKQIETQVIFF